MSILLEKSSGVPKQREKLLFNYLPVARNVVGLVILMGHESGFTAAVAA